MLKEKVIEYLEENPDKLVTGGQMALKFDVSRTAIWKTINTLKNEGYKIESVRNSGYRLSESSDTLSKTVIKNIATTDVIGQEIEIHKVLPSTNTYVKNSFNINSFEGYTVIADGQSQGRGRHGKSFCSPEQNGIYMSILLKPNIDFDKVSMITICTAVAVCNGIEKSVNMPLDLGIKWVNDLFIGNKKLCGILTEASISMETTDLEYVVVGIGVNTGEVDETVRDIATSLYLETGTKGHRNKIIGEILNEFEKVYNDFIKGNTNIIIDEYNKRLFIKNRKVEITYGKEVLCAKVIEVSYKGHLIVEKETGDRLEISSGEIVRLINE
ncbi:MAG: biotin--[acetyl-CoA-carboxylase] ligase [Lachnospirales bacterium]